MQGPLVINSVERKSLNIKFVKEHSLRGLIYYICYVEFLLLTIKHELNASLYALVEVTPVRGLDK